GLEFVDGTNERDPRASMSLYKRCSAECVMRPVVTENSIGSFFGTRFSHRHRAVGLSFSATRRATQACTCQEKAIRNVGTREHRGAGERSSDAESSEDLSFAACRS